LGNNNITRTQYGVEKDPHGDEDTLSSGQHQQWVLNERNNEVMLASTVLHGTETPVRMPTKKESYSSQTSTSNSKSRLQSISIPTSNRSSRPQHNPLQQAVESTSHDVEEAQHHTVATFTKTTKATSTSAVLESATKISNRHDHDNRSSSSSNPNADFTVQQVQGTTELPKKLRRGQRPKGRYVVY
jgi:hypothetical protein